MGTAVNKRPSNEELLAELSKTFWRKGPPIMDGESVSVGGMWPSQRQWWDLPNKVCLFVGGYGSGKSFVLGKKHIALSLAHTGAPTAIVSPTYTMSKEIIVPTLVDLLEGQKKLRSRIGQKFDYVMRKSPPVSFEIAFQYRNDKSHKQVVRKGRIVLYSGEKPDRLKGPNLGSAGIDEPFIQDEEVFRQMTYRVRHKKAPKRFRKINLTGCVTRDTWVWTPEGMQQIGDLDPGSAPKEYVDLGKKVYGRGRWREATKFFNNGVDDVWTLKASKGFEITATPDHPVLCMSPGGVLEFKRLGDRKGKYASLGQVDPETDYVAIDIERELWGGNNPEGLTLDDAYACGVWTAEGYMSEQNQVTITCKDPEVQEHFILKGMFGSLFRRQTSRPDQVRKTSREFPERFAKAGLKRVKAPFKQLPQWVCGGGTREFALAFLAGLYDGDGHVSKDGSGIGLTTTSEVMARQLHALLLNLGVAAHSSKTVTPPTERVKVYSTRWQVVATGQDAKKLASILPLRSSRKAACLSVYARELRDSSKIPHAGNLVLKLWETKSRQRWRKMDGEISGYRICESIRQTEGTDSPGVSYSYVKRFCELWRHFEPSEPDELLRLERFLKEGFRYLKIRSCNPVGRMETVDFVIPDENTFNSGFTINLQTPEKLNWGYELAEGDMREQFDVGIVQASSLENLATGEDYHKTLLEGMDPELQKAMIHGQFVNMSKGRVFYGFDRRKNVIAVQKPPGAMLGVGMDFNVNPMSACVFWVRTGRDPHIHFFHEIELPNSSTMDMCKFLIRKYHAHGLVDVYPDAAGRVRTTAGPVGQSDFRIIRECGFHIHARPEGNPSRRDRFNATNLMLTGVDGTPRMTIDPKCKALVKYMTLYAHDQMNTRAQKAMSHLLDAATYPVAYLFPWHRQTFSTAPLRGF